MGWCGEMAAGGQRWPAEAAETFPLHPPDGTVSTPRRDFPGPTREQMMLGTVSTLARRAGTTRALASPCQVCPRASSSPGKSTHTRGRCKPQCRTGRQRQKGFHVIYVPRRDTCQPAASVNAVGKASKCGAQQAHPAHPRKNRQS